MTDDTMRANWLEEYDVSAPTLAGDIDEAFACWRRAKFTVENYSVTSRADGHTMATTRIYRPAPYACTEARSYDPDVVTVSDKDARQAAVGALRLAAAKWPGVV